MPARGNRQSKGPVVKRDWVHLKTSKEQLESDNMTGKGSGFSIGSLQRDRVQSHNFIEILRELLS